MNFSFTNSANSKLFSINCNGRLIDLSKPKLMGILNLTPDSFSDGGKFNNEKSALQQAENLLKNGATIIDIGAQSTRPNSEYLKVDEEIRRIGNIISLIKKEFPESLISLDTFYSDVVRFGHDEGIDIVNDISAGQFDPELLNTVAETGLPYILMHINPTYGSMHEKIRFDDIILSINRFFSEKILELKQKGIKDIILDPGFGFGKTVEDQYKMIDEFEYVGFGKYPVLAGISKKSFIYKPLGKLANEVEKETLDLHLKLIEKGANIIRLHDPQTLKL
ncbi:dihydropteroate synthase [Epilithonimonas ginsengisoli]|uniref:Dihydropteroate synthase n=1 Tax=Epilithonimonas ginsengisoli TaxID=1245592 RepID=A0ABU4JJ06_9FLAO|nr:MULTISPECIES: dihydropteroate synthase [Chryseobacterium group]MDW8549641.1 dihydropteroate synthase [Epilithonimonas ginsengisoli]OAH76769.1 dihydropteroate synthase [Chryseobacterium sp. FP211-J200]